MAHIPVQSGSRSCNVARNTTTLGSDPREEFMVVDRVVLVVRRDTLLP